MYIHTLPSHPPVVDGKRDSSCLGSRTCVASDPPAGGGFRSNGLDGRPTDRDLKAFLEIGVCQGIKGLVAA